MFLSKILTFDDRLFESNTSIEHHNKNDDNTCLNETVNEINTTTSFATIPSQQTTSNLFNTQTRNRRQVFLCSACGTYYEKWNLFYHIREVHKKFICLFCLGIFSNAERLVNHLESKHIKKANVYEHKDDLIESFRDHCFLMCCVCEHIFSDNDDVMSHSCENFMTPCTDCGLKFIHKNDCSVLQSNKAPLKQKVKKSKATSLPQSNTNSLKTINNEPNAISPQTLLRNALLGQDQRTNNHYDNFSISFKHINQSNIYKTNNLQSHPNGQYGYGNNKQCQVISNNKEVESTPNIHRFELNKKTEKVQSSNSDTSSDSDDSNSDSSSNESDAESEDKENNKERVVQPIRLNLSDQNGNVARITSNQQEKRIYSNQQPRGPVNHGKNINNMLVNQEDSSMANDLNVSGNEGETTGNNSNSPIHLNGSHGYDTNHSDMNTIQWQFGDIQVFI